MDQESAINVYTIHTKPKSSVYTCFLDAAKAFDRVMQSLDII